MKEDMLYDSFLEEIVKRIPQRVEAVNVLADMLCIGREAVYRRLRKDVPFTFHEVITISRQLDISLDELELADSTKTMPFKLKLIEFVNPAASDFAFMEGMTEIMRSFKEGSEAEVSEITNILPRTMYVGYKSVFKFYLFKWKYQSNKSHQATPYKEIAVLDRMYKTQEEYVTLAKRLHATYVFDHQLFQNLVTNVKYFYRIGLIDREDLLAIRDDLFRILDEINFLSRTGVRKETGKKVDIYISSVNVDTNYLYVSAPDYHLTIIKAFLLNGVTSTDRTTFEEVKSWMRSLQKQSVLITGSGERERVDFIDRQSKIVESLSQL